MQRDEEEAYGIALPVDAYINRELSWLSFNRRVLHEAVADRNPLLERARFLSITASNLDEFMMVRYASLQRRVERGRTLPDPSGLSPMEQLAAVEADVRRLMQEQSDVYGALMPELTLRGLRIWRREDLSPEQRKWAERSFRKEILPLLSAHPLGGQEPVPAIAGRALQVGILMEQKKRGGMALATVQMPQGLPRAWRMPDKLGGGFLCIEQMVALSAAQLVPPGSRLISCHPYRVTRDEDYVVADNPDTQNLIAQTRISLSRRKTGAIVRLEVEQDAQVGFLSHLCKALDTPIESIFRVDAPLDLTFLSKAIHDLSGMDAYRYAPFLGRMPAPLAANASIFDALRKGDVFLHHPYDSFDAVLRFIREAADDPRVLAISITLYRVSGDSPVIWALCDAAEAGKRVTVLLELKARFDEENNIHWAQVLRRAGCEVIYGMPRLKTHSKIALVVRREAEGLKRYMHLGTGNYNDVTAAQYADMGLLTCDADLGEDAQAFFNMIVGFSKEPTMKRLIYAPRTLRPALLSLIGRERDNALAGKPSGIDAKMNSLVDPQIIAALYEASAAGVPIRLIVRGICCLRVGIPRLSDTIEVRSLVGRYLEHSRIFRFENAGDPEVFLSSADWMPRNLNRRIELMFPILDPLVRMQIEQILRLQTRPDVRAWQMLASGRYREVPQGEDGTDAQAVLMTLPDP